MSAADLILAWAATIAVLSFTVWVMVKILHAMTH